MHHSEVIAIRPDLDPRSAEYKAAKVRPIFVHERCAVFLLEGEPTTEETSE
jgi:hypothetical protein